MCVSFSLFFFKFVVSEAAIYANKDVYKEGYRRGVGDIPNQRFLLPTPFKDSSVRTTASAP